MAMAMKSWALPFPQLRSGRVRSGHSGEGDRVPTNPREARQIRLAIQVQRQLGVGRWPGVTHEQFESAVLRRIQRPW